MQISFILLRKSCAIEHLCHSSEWTFFPDFLQLGVLSTDFIIWQSSWLLSSSNVRLFLAGLVDSFPGRMYYASMSATAANQLRSRFGWTWSAFHRIRHFEDIMFVTSFKRWATSWKFRLFICGNPVLSSISSTTANELLTRFSTTWCAFDMFHHFEDIMFVTNFKLSAVSWKFH